MQINNQKDIGRVDDKWDQEHFVGKGNDVWRWLTEKITKMVFVKST